MCAGRGQGYAGQGLALADVLAHLYFRVMRRRPDGSYLDRFVLSTGHSAVGLFAALGEVGLGPAALAPEGGQPVPHGRPKASQPRPRCSAGTS